MTPEIPHWSKDHALRRTEGLLCRLFGHKVRIDGYRIYCARSDNTLGDSRDGWPPLPRPVPPPPEPPDAAMVRKWIEQNRHGIADAIRDIGLKESSE